MYFLLAEESDYSSLKYPFENMLDTITASKLLHQGLGNKTYK